MGFLRKFYFGQYGLGKTYWLGFVGAGVVNYILTIALTRYYWFVSEAHETLYEFFMKGVGLFGLLVLLYFAMAVFNAAKINGKRSVWGWLATIAVFIAVIRIVLAIIASFTDSYLTWSQLQEEIKVINATLPAQLDIGLTMSKVVASQTNKSVTYYYKENEPYAQYDLKATSQNYKQDLLAGEEGICSDLPFLTTGLVETVVFNYSGTDGKSFDVIFRQQDCQ
jgi:hypothetical protein